MLTRNRARILNIEIPPISIPSKSNIQGCKRKRTNIVECSHEERKHPKMVSFEENIDYINYKPLYEVNIDFDEAHDAWVANKIKQKNGCYKYRKTKSVS
jgi:hypothetical protein